MTIPLGSIIPKRCERQLSASWARLRETERLAQSGITVAEAARALGIRPNAMWCRVHRYGVTFPGSRGPYRRSA